MQDRIKTFLSNFCILLQTSTGISPSDLMMRRKGCTCFDLIHPETGQNGE